MAEIERILVPMDLHLASEAKVPFAAAQAKAFGASIILLHVLAPERPDGGVVSTGEAQARTYLDAIVARLRGDDITAQTLICWGDPAQTILDEIITQRADLVVLGSTYRTGFSLLRLGSVAEDIIARAACPVLLVRPAREKTSRPLAVRSFNEDVARAGPVAQRNLGLRTVELGRIIGSVGRAADLDASFNSRGRRRLEDQRSRRIETLMQEGGGLPPIDLYKLGYGYYVLDGNHRVAAALHLGMPEIEANVTEFVPLGDTEAQRMAAERRAFERATGLTRIGAAVPGNYGHLEELIRAYAAGTPDANDLATAASRWEADVYRPVAEKIRGQRLTQRYPGERTADVFVRAASLRADLSQDSTAPVDWATVLKRLRLIPASR